MKLKKKKLQADFLFASLLDVRQAQMKISSLSLRHMNVVIKFGDVLHSFMI